MEYQWIRESPEEFFTGEYDIAGNPIYAIPDDVIIQTFVDIGETQEVVNPIKAQDLYYYLHSLLRNDFYRSLTDAQQEELQNLLNEAMKLSNIYNTNLFLGSELEYKSRVTNVTTLLGFNLPLFFADKIGAQKGEFNLVDRIKWFRELLQATYLLRRWAGSASGYNAIFKFIKKKGTTFLRAQYKTDGFNSQTNRFYRIIKADHFSKNLIESPQYPISQGIAGETDYASAKPPKIQFDTRLTFDKTGDDGDPSKFDATVQYAGKTTKGLSLEVALDELLLHYNSIHTNKCLMDNDWLKALSTLLPTVKKGSDKVSIGCQLSLTALCNGRYTKYPESADPVELKKYLYTHPNIEAKFQIFPSRFGRATPVSYIMLGTGTLSDVFNTSTVENFEVLMKEYPNNIAKPLFKSYVGHNEQFLLGKYKTISSMVHSQIIQNQNIAFEHIYINKELTPVTQVTTIKFPHSSLSPGSFSFTLHLPAPEINGVANPYHDRFLYITQTYNEPLNIYDPLVRIKKPASITTGADLAKDAERMLISGLEWDTVVDKCRTKYSLTYTQMDKLSHVGNEVSYGTDEGDASEVIRRVLKEVSNKSYSMFVNDSTFFSFADPVEASFMKPDPDSFITLEAIPGKYDSRGNPIYTDIDLLEGTLQLRLKYDIENEIGRIAGEGQTSYDPMTSEGVISYEINSLKSGTVDQLDLEAASRVAITELGLFDDDDRMIAYGTFPPIIYDSSKYHSSYNLAIDTTPMINVPLKYDGLTHYYSFNNVPTIPDNSIGTVYVQSEWNTVDSWQAGIGVKAISKSFATSALMVEGSGSFNYQEITRAGVDSTGSILRFSIKYNPSIAAIKVKDGSLSYNATLYREGDYYLGTYTFKNSNPDQLTIYVVYTSAIAARSNITEISWIYVGTGAYQSSVEDESPENHPLVLTRTTTAAGIQSSGVVFLDPTSYCIM